MIWSSLAHAQSQESSPARRCAEAAAGAEVEVCLRLAAEHPDRVDEIVSALVAWVDRAEAPDRALLDALLLLHGDRAVEGVARLAALEDPRSTALLAHAAVSDLDPAVRGAAVAALGPRPEALPLIAAVIADRDEVLAVRSAGVETLGAAGSEAAAEALVGLLRRTGLPPALRLAMEQELARRWPERFDERTTPDGSEGAIWLATGSAVGLGYAMGAAGWFGDDDLLPVGVLAGGTAGASVGWLYGRAWPLDAGDAALVTTSGLAGTGAGFLVGLGASDGDLDAAWLTGLGGEVAGFGLGALSARSWRGDPRDVAEGAAMTVGVAGAVGLGAHGLGAGDGVAELGAGLALAAGSVVGPSLGRPFRGGQDWPFVLTGAAAGGFAAALAPLDGDPASLAAAGALGGGVLGGWLGATADPRADLVIGAVTGGGFGAATGYGLGLVAEGSPELAGGLGLAGMGLGVASGAAIALVDRDPIDDRDVAFTTAAVAWSAWNAVAIAELAGAEPAQRAGGVLLATAGAAGVTTAANLLVDAPIPETLCATSLGVWAGYGGQVVASLVDADPVAVALPASDAGLALGALLVSPWVGTPPLVIGVADAGGAIGGSATALVVSLAGGSSDAVHLATLSGAAGGAAVGAALGTRWYRSAGRRDMALLRWPSAPPVALGPGPTALGATLVVGPW